MFYFFSRDKKNVCFMVGAKKKNCVLIFQKKKTYLKVIIQPPPQKSNGASLNEINCRSEKNQGHRGHRKVKCEMS